MYMLRCQLKNNTWILKQEMTHESLRLPCRWIHACSTIPCAEYNDVRCKVGPRRTVLGRRNRGENIWGSLPSQKIKTKIIHLSEWYAHMWLAMYGLQPRYILSYAVFIYYPWLIFNLKDTQKIKELVHSLNSFLQDMLFELCLSVNTKIANGNICAKYSWS